MRTLSILGLGVVLSACASGPADSGSNGSDGLGASIEALRYQQASATHGVPRDLVVAIAAVEGGIGMPAQRDVAEEVEVPAAGPLMLRRGKLNTLALAAQLSGHSEWTLRRDTDLALVSGAQVLAKVARENGAHADDLASYFDTVKEMSGYADELHREEYAHRVFAQLARGGTFEGRDGQSIILPPHDLPPTLVFDLSTTLHTLAGAEYPGALYFPIPAASASSKFTVGRGGASVSMVVIHDTEGGWDGSVATLQNDAGKSVEYIVGQDGRVGQFMPEADTAYHAGNFYYNQRSVGIEHVGYANRAYPALQYTTSAKLVKYLANKYTVPLDRAHLIGHDQVPNGNAISSSSPPCSLSPVSCEAGSNYGGSNNHRDPGIWEWARLMYLTGGKAKVNDVTPQWKCSSDNLFAFRSSAGAVEVLECTTCTTKAAGVDDVCVAKNPPPAPTTTPTTTPTTPTPVPTTVPTTTPTSPASSSGASAAPAPGSSSGCCAVGPTRANGEGSLTLLLAAACATVVMGRRRYRRG